MGVLSVDLKPNSETAQDRETERSFGYTLIVRCSSERDPSSVVKAAAGVPRIGSPYSHPLGTEANSAAVCRSVMPRYIGPRQWEVTCQFSAQAWEQGDGKEETPLDPLSRRPKRSWSGTIYDTYPEKDAAGKWITTSAHELVNPRPSIPRAYNVLNITRNEAYFDVHRSVEFQNSVNDATWIGFAAGTAWFLPPDAEEIAESGITYVRVTYHFQINSAGWDEEFLDRGTYYWVTDTSTGKKRLQRVSQPVLLDGEGGKLSAERIRQGDFAYVKIQRFKRRNFALLNLE